MLNIFPKPHQPINKECILFPLLLFHELRLQLIFRCTQIRYPSGPTALQHGFYPWLLETNIYVRR